MRATFVAEAREQNLTELKLHGAYCASWRADHTQVDVAPINEFLVLYCDEIDLVGLRSTWTVEEGWL